MPKLAIVAFVCLTATLAFAQSSSSQWQRGTVTGVETHAYGPGETATDVAQYDVSIRVGSTIYVVLYAPARDVSSVRYSPGVDILVLVGNDTLTFNSLSGTTQARILSRQILPTDGRFDWSKLPGDYYSLELEHLSGALKLNEEQRTKVRPILEQETAELGLVWRNPALSTRDKIDAWQKITGASSKKLKPILSSDQLQKLRDLRQEEKAEIKRRSAEQKQKEAELR